MGLISSGFSLKTRKAKCARWKKFRILSVFGEKKNASEKNVLLSTTLSSFAVSFHHFFTVKNRIRNWKRDKVEKRRQKKVLILGTLIYSILLKTIKLLLYKYPLKKGCLPFKILNGKHSGLCQAELTDFFLHASLKTDTFLKRDFGVLSL